MLYPEATRNQQQPSTDHQQCRPKNFSSAKTFQGAVVKEEGQPPPPSDPPPSSAPMRVCPAPVVCSIAGQAGVDIAPLAEKTDIVQQILETMSRERLTEMGGQMGLHMHLTKVRGRRGMWQSGPVRGRSPLRWCRAEQRPRQGCREGAWLPLPRGNGSAIPRHSRPGRSFRDQIFFFCEGLRLRTAPRDHQPPTANSHQPPTATNRQPPTATNRRQPPAATNRQLPTTANRHQPPTTNHQPPPATTNRHQPPVANCQPPTAANRQPPPTATNHG